MLDIAPIYLRMVKRRNPLLPIRIHKINPPLQHQSAITQMLSLMDICRTIPYGSSSVHCIP